MRCMNCYQEISDSCKFCPNCGAKQPVQKMEPVSQVKEETIDNITEDTAEVQQPTEKVQSEEDVLPEKKVAARRRCAADRTNTASGCGRFISERSIQKCESGAEYFLW
mgnify:CR=1 FL=1